MPASARISVTLFHGSKTSGLTRLDPAASESGHAFGPGIYAAKDRTIAECQHGCKAVYRFKASGPQAGILELNQPLKFQSVFAAEAIGKVCNRYRLASNPHNGEPIAHWLALAVREIIERGTEYPADLLVNRALADEGVWLLRGTVDPMAATLPQDRGIQWCILTPEAISNLEEQPRYITTPEVA